MNERLLMEWRDPLLLGLQVLVILLAAYLLQRLVVRGLGRLGSRYPLPPELLLPLRGADVQRKDIAYLREPVAFG